MNVTLSNNFIAVEYKACENAFNKILEDIKTDDLFLDDPQLSSAVSWIDKVCRYNIPHGKKLRGLLVPLTVRSLIKSPSIIQMEEDYILGWCVEILQAACLIADDIMDNGKTRRGQPCWYLVDGLGPNAFNDTLLLEHIVYRLLRKHFKKTSFYILLDLFLQVIHKTVLGQCLDTQKSGKGGFDEYTMERYEAIVKYKTSYYTFYLPIALAATLANVESVKLLKNLEAITMNIGYMFQVYDDYLDCFGSEAEIGKFGTDIQNGKCSWLFVRAKELCSKDQLAILDDNYGQDDFEKVSVVKVMYDDLKLPNHFLHCINETKKISVEAVQKLENEDIQMLMYQLFNMIEKKFKIN